MRRLIVLSVLTFAPAASAADEEKPVTLKPDELAALADPDSAEHRKVLQRYDGQILKFTGPVKHMPGNRFYGWGSGQLFAMQLPPKKKGDKPLTVQMFFAKAPNSEKTVEALKRDSPRPTQMTVYGRAAFSYVSSDGSRTYIFQGLTDASTDPRVAASPPKPPAKK